MRLMVELSLIAAATNAITTTTTTSTCKANNMHCIHIHQLTSNIFICQWVNLCYLNQRKITIIAEAMNESKQPH